MKRFITILLGVLLALLAIGEYFYGSTAQGTQSDPVVHVTPATPTTWTGRK